MPDYIRGRDLILEQLRQELVGPKPVGYPLNTSAAVRFRNWKEANGPWHDADTGEEILTTVGPSTRYGVGVLYPQASRSLDSVTAEANELPEDKRIPDEALAELTESLSASLRAAGTDKPEDDDLDLTSANSYRPSSMGITCRVHVPTGSRIALTGDFGRYLEVHATIGESERTWHRRSPVSLNGAFTAAGLCQSPVRSLVAEDQEARQRSGDDRLDIEVRAYSRPTDQPDERLVTFYIANKSGGGKDTASLYQSGFAVEAQDGAAILPYREQAHELSDDPEQASLHLLYRHHETFGIGHGCAADWEKTPSRGQVFRIEATPLPVYEAASITPVIKLPGRADGLEIDMRALADEQRGREADHEIRRLLEGYGAWISLRHAEVADLSEEMRGTAHAHLRDCETALARMAAGWNLVQNDPVVRKAFTLANRAMMTQQARASKPLRAVAMTSDDRFAFSGRPPVSEPGKDRGTWRPFQIAFFLAVLESVADSASEHRDTAELIFFPTGGGKTEAYLAVAAFSMFLRRLRDPEDAGTEVLMRYTLRLLSAQQFLRASSLVCAMEEMREGLPELGEAEFSIGIWVGGSSTPNKRSGAVEKFNKLADGGDNPFLLLRCPWCNAEFGPVADRRTRRRGRKKKIPITGYQLNQGKFQFRCSDSRCHFSRRSLPVYVVDEDIYDKRPTLVIGTVDKFAMLAWRPKARALFGIGMEGARVCSPPGLVVQDELHLISGPLGSMTGLYEAVIEDLCTDDRAGTRVRPKIVASTATIRRYGEQIRNLYGRRQTRLFPPHGLSADDSFFAAWARKEDGTLQPGRRYVGVHGPGLGSMQTVQVRTASALLQAPMELPAEERDPWWTCLTFFNSLRELGNTLTLLQADIPSYLGGLNLRDGLDRSHQRWPRRTPELTGRLFDDQIPKAIASLEIDAASRGCVDVCLASNIIEVGVDIDRLSLMTVVGQPKTTSQYIQVTGRVGRRWQERPGLVVTLYGATKPRDRSHFERFRSYHERLYAQVEPTSVTPFALPVLERAVHAALVTYVRQRGPERLDPLPFPEDLAYAAAQLLRERAMTIGGIDAHDLERIIARRLREWTTRERDKWDANPDFGDPERGLMRFPGTAVPASTRQLTWETPSSMRNVDSNCKIEVTPLYAAAASAEDGEQT